MFVLNTNMYYFLRQHTKDKDTQCDEFHVHMAATT